MPASSRPACSVASTSAISPGGAEEYFKDGTRCVRAGRDSARELISKYLFSQADKEAAGRQAARQHRRPPQPRSEFRMRSLCCPCCRRPALPGRRPRRRCAGDPGSGPQQLIETVSQDMLRDIRRGTALRCARIRRSSVRSVDKNLLPHSDTDYAARLVLRQALAHGRRRSSRSVSSTRHPVDDAPVRQCDASTSPADRLKILPFKGIRRPGWRRCAAR